VLIAGGGEENSRFEFNAKQALIIFPGRDKKEKRLPATGKSSKKKEVGQSDGKPLKGRPQGGGKRGFNRNW